MEAILLLKNGLDIQPLQEMIEKYPLNLDFSIIITDDFSNKNLKRLSTLHTQRNHNTPFLFFEKDSLILAMVTEQDVIKSSLNWQSLQKRIVSAGKNNELILKACKLNKEMSVIDGTAGFGQDGLILASTGASVNLIEQNPILFLMLIFEQQKMSQNPNWQKLMARITIVFGDSNEIIKQMLKHDLIYFDPMFPNDSYKGAVNKNMQVLHQFINPPSFNDEIVLFETAMANCDKLIIKRPLSAPNFAGKLPIQSVNNEVIRFDVYMENN
ncbi:MAG: class I SAM-dependent methyltransferase [Moraxella sp.]|nr:class I SAM-dependent methyltransferase [Moraxella sp.]